MHKEDIISFKDILNYPQHFIHELEIDPGSSFLLYQYGPYLIMNNNMAKYRKEISYEKNPIFRFMIDVGTLLKLTHSTPKVMKDIMLDIVKSLPTNGNEWSNKVREIVKDMMKNLRDYQYENHVLESAMIDYCPIVPYTRTIVKPDMQSSTSSESENVLSKYKHSSIEFTDEVINTYLKENIIDIMMKPKAFLSVENHYDLYHLKDEEYSANLSCDILSLCENKTDPALFYFLMVYLRYCVKKEEYENVVESLINLNTSYNKIIKGDLVSIPDIIDQLSDIALPESNTLL